MNLSPVNDMLLLERSDKLRKKTSDSPFTSVSTSNNLATVRYSSSEEYPVGTQVYFASTFEVMTIEGVELIAIKKENVVAKVTE